MSLVFLGIDPASTRLAAVITYGKTYVIEKRTMPTDPVERCYAAYKWARRLVKKYREHGDVVVGVELAVFGKGGPQGTLPIAMIHGALVAGAKASGAVLVHPVNNQTWKSRIVGIGNAKKPQIAEFVRKTWPKLYAEAMGNQDVLDAACINRYSEYYYNFQRRVAATRAKHERLGGKRR